MIIKLRGSESKGIPLPASPNNPRTRPVARKNSASVESRLCKSPQDEETRGLEPFAVGSGTSELKVDKLGR